MPTKKVVKVDPDKCIGCNTCPLVDPETFILNTTTYKAEVIKQPETITQIIETAVTSCPVGAISIVEE